MHLGPRGQRLEQPPLRARQVLEAVGEDRTVPPCVEHRRSSGRRLAAGPCPGPRRRAGRARRGRPAASERERLRRGRPARAARCRAPPARRPTASREARRVAHRSAGGAARCRRISSRALRLAQQALAATTAASERRRTACRTSRSFPRAGRPTPSRSSRSTCSTSARWGTISHGSRSSAATNRSRERPDLAGVCRPDDERETHRAMVVGRLRRPVLRRGRQAPTRHTASGTARPTRATWACDPGVRQPLRACRPHTNRTDRLPSRRGARR